MEPQSWDSGLGKPFSGKNGVQAGGGEEPELNYAMNTATVLPYGEEKDCNVQAGKFLKGCVYLEDIKLRPRKLEKCATKIDSIAANCVFGGPVSE